MDTTKISYKEFDKYQEEVLKKVRNEEDFSADEINTLFHMLDEVDNIEHEHNRWTASVDTIFSIQDTYILVSWEQGLTEYQENEFYYNPVEVYPKEEKIVITKWYPVNKKQ